MQVMECPQCSAPTKPSEQQCAYCKSEFFVTSLGYLGRFDSNGVGKYLKHYKDIIDKDSHNTEGLLGLGLCYLQMGTYPLAQKHFENIIESSPEVSQAYYYYALACIKGRRLMTLSFSEAQQLETYLNTAIQLDSGVSQYKLLLAMLKRDYYEINGLKVPPPNATELLNDIEGEIIDQNELEQMSKSVKVSGQDEFLKVLSIV